MVDRDRLAVVAVGVALMASLTGAAYVSGVADPMLDGGTATETPTPPATATDGSGDGHATEAGADDGTAGGGGSATRTPPSHDFEFRIVNTESCGDTCRDVTVRLTNRGTETATGVGVKSRIFVEADEIWTGTEDIGTVDAGESVTRTERVELGVFEARKVQRNGGYVTVKTTVTWDGGRQTFTQRIKAA